MFIYCFHYTSHAGSHWLKSRGLTQMTYSLMFCFLTDLDFSGLSTWLFSHCEFPHDFSVIVIFHMTFQSLWHFFFVTLQSLFLDFHTTLSMCNWSCKLTCPRLAVLCFGFFLQTWPRALPWNLEDKYEGITVFYECCQSHEGPPENTILTNEIYEGFAKFLYEVNEREERCWKQGQEQGQETVVGGEDWNLEKEKQRWSFSYWSRTWFVWWRVAKSQWKVQNRDEPKSNCTRGLGNCQQPGQRQCAEGQKTGYGSLVDGPIIWERLSAIYPNCELWPKAFHNWEAWNQLLERNDEEEIEAMVDAWYSFSTCFLYLHCFKHTTSYLYTCQICWSDEWHLHMFTLNHC